MKMTFKKGINAESLILKHNILLQASDLAMGREGALQTEKDLYLMMAHSLLKLRVPLPYLILI